MGDCFLLGALITTIKALRQRRTKDRVLSLERN